MLKQIINLCLTLIILTTGCHRIQILGNSEVTSTDVSSAYEFPGFLRAVTPPPNSTYSVGVYQQMALVPLYSGKEPGVCILIGSIRFLEPGDFYTAEEWIERQVIVFVNGLPVSLPNTIYLTNSSGVEKNNLETGELEWREPDGSPIAACYSVDLGVGVHTAEVVVKTTSGEETNYVWSFELTK